MNNKIKDYIIKEYAHKQKLKNENDFSDWARGYIQGKLDLIKALLIIFFDYEEKDFEENKLIRGGKVNVNRG